MFIDRNYKATMEENTTLFLFLLDFVNSLISLTCKNYLRARRKKCGSFWPLLVKARSVQKVHIPIVQVIETTLSFWYHLKNKKLAYQTFFLNVVIYTWFGKHFFLITIYWKNRTIASKDLYNIYFLFYFWHA